MSEFENNQPTYINPVHARSCPDPFVLKYLNEYWCFCTGVWHDGRCFGVLHSRDLVHWQEMPGAMERINDEATCYWAPEVIYDNGRFLMYYSVGNEEFMEIRVALADHPAGPYVDADRRLTSEPFAIDPHVFRDADGRRYLFYATDFLEHSHVGTGTVCDEMLDAFTLAGDPRPVTRARFDWQVYDPARAEKGGVRWHTVEGPSVLQYKGLYYQMFSGGNWQNTTYGVGYAVSDRVLRNDEWDQVADGERVLPILRTIPGRVVGAGHNSAVRGTNNVEMYCVYHRWSEDRGERVLAIDRMDWAGERLFVIGATTTPQPAPSPATFADDFGRHDFTGRQEMDSGESWQCSGGRWVMRDGAATQEVGAGYARAHKPFYAPYFVAEVSARLLPHTNSRGEFGIALFDKPATGHEGEPALRFRLLPASHRARIEWRAAEPDKGVWAHQDFTLPGGFNFHVFHLLRVEVNGMYVKFRLDDTIVEWEGQAQLQPQSLCLWTENAAAAFSGFSLTHGWQDLFVGPHTSPCALNWDIDPADETWLIRDRQLWHPDPRKVGSVLGKGPLPGDYEFIVNVRLYDDAGADPNGSDGRYGFLPAMSLTAAGPLVTIGYKNDGWRLRCEQAGQVQEFSLPADFTPHRYQQFRFRKVQTRLVIQHEVEVLGETEVSPAAARVGLYSSGAVTAFDKIVVTAV